MTKLKWGIERTPENYNEVNEWANKVHSEPFQFGNEYRSMIGYVHSDLQDHGSLSHEHKNNHYTEITLDEFRLLTDPEKYCTYSKVTKHINGQTGYITYQEGRIPWGNEISTTPSLIHPPVSEHVFNELQRMWKEREGININAAWFDESNEVTPEMLSNLSKNRGTNSIKDRDMSGIIGLLPKPKFHVDDFKTESEKQTLKLLKKINRKLNRILKRQKEQF